MAAESSSIFILIGLVLTIMVLRFLLPAINGVGQFKLRQPQRHDPEQENTEQEEEEEYQGYLPPDELKRREEAKKKKESQLKRLKKNLNITMEDTPLRFSSSSAQRPTRLRRRVKNVDPADRDPSKFDFDLDELIADGEKEDREEQEKAFKQRITAQNTEELEELV